MLKYLQTALSIFHREVDVRVDRLYAIFGQNIVQHMLIVQCNSIYVDHKSTEIFVLQVTILSCWNTHAASSLLHTIGDTANSLSLITNTTWHLRVKYRSNTVIQKNEACVAAATCNIDGIADVKSDKPLTLSAIIELKTLKLPSWRARLRYSG
jgi:hypothetical protein